MTQVTPRSPLFLLFTSFCFLLLLSEAGAQPKPIRSDPRREAVITAVSPDGSQLAIARSSYDVIAQNGRVELWDLKTGELRQTLTGFDGSVVSLIFHPDGKRLITTSMEHRQSKIQAKPRDRSGDNLTEVKWWNVVTGEFIRKVTLDGRFGYQTVVSPDGATIAIETRYLQTNLYNLPFDIPASPFDNVLGTRIKQPLREAYEIKLFDTTTGVKKRQLSGNANAFVNRWVVRFIPPGFSPDGKLMAVSCAREVQIWDLATGKKVQTIKKFDGTPVAVEFSADSQTLAISSAEESPVDHLTLTQSQISVWEIAGAKLIRNLRGNNDLVASLKFSGDGKALLLGTLQYEPERTIGTVKMWDFVTNRLATFNVHEDKTVSSLRLLPGRSELLLQLDQDVEIRDTRSWRVKQLFEANRDDQASRSANRFLLSVKQIVAIGFSPDGVTVSGVVPEEPLRFWDSRTGGVKQGPEIQTTNGLFARSGDGHFFAEVTAKEMKLWDLTTRSSRVLPNGSSVQISAVALSHDGQLLAVGEGTSIKLRKLTNEGSVRTLSGHDSSIEQLSFSSDSRTLVSTDEVGTIKVWDISVGELKRSIPTGNLVTAMAVDSSGQFVATAGPDYLISVWNTASGALQSKLKKHENVVNAVAFSPDGKTLASGGDDRTVVLWDVLAGKSKEILKGHDLTVTSLAFSPDGQTLAAGSGNASVVLWNVTNGKLDRVLR